MKRFSLKRAQNYVWKSRQWIKVLLHNQELCAISGNTKRNSKLWKLTTKSDPISTLLFVITYNNVSHSIKKIRNTKRFENCNQTFLYTICVEDARKFSKRHLTVLNSCRYLFLRMVFWLHFAGTYFFECCILKQMRLPISSILVSKESFKQKQRRKEKTCVNFITIHIVSIYQN